jgi:hypothetical protein
MSRKSHLLRSAWAGAEYAPALLLAAGVAALGVPTARAQTTATVAVNAGSSLATISPNAFGINTAVWDSVLTDSKLPALVSGAGITAMRYPGGSTADTYNWQTNSINPNLGGYANPSNGFDTFMTLAKAAGATPVITVNYGSDTAGTGGGTPAFAADWCNMPTSPRATASNTGKSATSNTATANMAPSGRPICTPRMIPPPMAATWCNSPAP